jgi:hypothetical protein
MSRKPNPLLNDFLDASVPLPDIHWETVPPGVDPAIVWESYDECVDGWVPVWFPSHDPVSGRSYGEFERASLFDQNLVRILLAMHRWPLWGTAKLKKHAVAIALLQLYCELMNLCERV